MTHGPVGVSIVTFHSDLGQLGRTLSALAAQSVPATTVLIHVNEATDAEVDAVTESLFQSGLAGTVTRSADNLGFAAGHNQSMAALYAASAGHVLVLNPDVELAAVALEELVTFAATTPHAICGPVLLLASPDTGASEDKIDTVGIVWTASGRHLDGRQGEPVSNLPAAPELVAGCSGACLLVSREAHLRIVSVCGEFFDADFIAYREDAELAFRAGLLGVQSWLVPSAVGLHARGLRGTSRAASPHVNRLGVRNRFLIAAKYGRSRPGAKVRPWLRDLVVLAGVVTTERSSWQGVTQAWRLRRHMRAKGRVVAEAVGRG